MKIALAQLNYHIGNFELNTGKILGAISRAKDEGADLVVFSELAICGYPPLDFLEFTDFVRHCEKSVERIAKACTGIAAIVGTASVNPTLEGKNLYNSAVLLSDGKVQSVTHKTLLPNYDVFDEYRYFEPNTVFHCLEFKGQRIALTVCEDLWDVEEDKMYLRWPMEELIKQKPDLLINIAASPFSYTHARVRKRVLHQTAVKYGLPVFYVNHVGAQTELIFDGGSLVMNKEGNVVCELNYFEEDFRIIDAGLVNTARSVPFSAENIVPSDFAISRIHDALILGIRDYFRKMNFSKAILGLSGGIDSALVYALAIEALGAGNVLGVMMPSPYSSGHSVDDSLELAKRTGGQTELIRIDEAFATIQKGLSVLFKGYPGNLAEENIQARIRAVYLMAMSNKFGHILLNTSNKSEAAVGYGTLYGDMAGGLSVIGDIYKTQVYELARYINRNEEIIPVHILVKAPSAELRPDQRDSDSLPDYDMLDKVLYSYIEERKGPSELIEAGFEKALVYRVLKMVNTNEYKRFQLPPVLRVSTKAFGLGRRMPIVGNYLS